MFLLPGRLKDPNVLMMIGLVFLVLADTTRYLVRWHVMTVDHSDGLMGFFMGIAIGTLLLSVSKRARERSSRM